MRGLFLTLTVLMITACLGGGHLPKEIVEECSNRALGLVIDTDQECVEAAYKRKDEAECTANPEKYSYAVATPELSLKERNHQICLVKKEQVRSLAKGIREYEKRKRDKEELDNSFKTLGDPEPCFTKNCF